MRSKYLAVLLRKFREKDFIWLLKQILKYPTIQLSYLFGRPLNGPMLGVLILTYQCNQQCIMCDLWRPLESCKKMNKEALTIEEWEKVIDDLVDMGASAVIFSGGEPLLKKDILILIKYAKERGLLTNISTNGILLEPELIKQLLDVGLDEVNISLDGINASTHDKIRGSPGSYEKTIRAIRNISLLRENHQNRILLTVTCSISEINLNEVIELVSFVSDLGVDRIGFIPVHDIMFTSDTESRSRQILITDLKKVEEIISQLIAMKRRTNNIDCSIKYLRSFNNYFSKKKSPFRCYAGYITCVVDCYGDIFPCFPFVTISKPVVNMREVSLREGWNSGRFNEVRRSEIKKCQKCNWNCWSELNAMFNF